MKKILISILVLFLNGTISYTQCNNNVSTYPFGPTNNALPDKVGFVNNPDDRYLNRFDWLRDDPNLYPHDEYTLTGMNYNPTHNSSAYKDLRNKNLSNSSEMNEQILEASLNKNKFSFSLFPNPTSSQTTLKVSGEFGNQVSIVVFDIAGKEQIIPILGNENLYTLDLSTLSKGIYLVKVSTFGESQTKQLIIQ